MPHRRSGFTLVEMLVSVALVVLMMLLFAEVYQLAGSAMSSAKGLAENDQRVRTLTTLLRGDVERRTFQTVIPFRADETSLSPDAPFNEREGYIYISENDPDSDIDDVIQFTIATKIGEEYPLFGRAAMIGSPSELNQPEADDGQIEIAPDGMDMDTNPDVTVTDNGTGGSRFAEVAYFLRNGNLYRRQMLVRDRFDDPVGDPRPAATLTDQPGFWRDFDYSAYYAGSVQFVCRDRLGVSSALPLANPGVRFGFDFITRNPREYADASDDATFFGRFTHAETSSDQFTYPGQNPDSDSDGSEDKNPHSPAMTLTFNNGTFDEFSTGSRIGEDLLLSYVHGFDVKVWDEAVNSGRGGFVDIGHGDTTGDFAQSKNAHRQSGAEIEYGPRWDVDPSENRVFDTWMPGFDFNGGGNDPPPFRPIDGSGNPKRIRAVQFTIRFLDPPSGQMRQLTLRIPLVQ